MQQIRETVLQKTVDGMREEGTPYVGECREVCVCVCVCAHIHILCVSQDSWQ